MEEFFIIQYWRLKVISSLNTLMVFFLLSLLDKRVPAKNILYLDDSLAPYC